MGAAQRIYSGGSSKSDAMMEKGWRSGRLRIEISQSGRAYVLLKKSSDWGGVNGEREGGVRTEGRRYRGGVGVL
jgi:hypothetical protein